MTFQTLNCLYPKQTENYSKLDCFFRSAPALTALELSYSSQGISPQFHFCSALSQGIHENDIYSWVYLPKSSICDISIPYSSQKEIICANYAHLKKCSEQEEKVYFLAVVAVYETITEEPWAPCYSGHTPLLHKSQVTTACTFLAQLSMMCQW